MGLQLRLLTRYSHPAATLLVRQTTFFASPLIRNMVLASKAALLLVLLFCVSGTLVSSAALLGRFDRLDGLPDEASLSRKGRFLWFVPILLFLQLSTTVGVVSYDLANCNDC